MKSIKHIQTRTSSYRNKFRGAVWLVIIVCFQTLQAQDYERIDATILLYPQTVQSPEELSYFITRDFTSEEEKIRAIYSWMIQNIAYYPEAYKMFNYNFKNYRERNLKEEKTRKKIIEFTLQNGLAVCEGYAMTFEKLLELQGITNYLVRGDTKTNFNDIGRSYDTNHMWNVAQVDGEPQLFDLTWGAGKYNGTFIKEPSYFYYKTRPELFFKSHYPDMIEDAFIVEKVSREEFAQRPLLIEKELLLSDIDMPKEGILSATNYLGEIPFQIRFPQPKTVSFSYGTDKVPVAFSIEEAVLKFSIPVVLGAENLLIYFDDQPALAYKIK